MEQGEIERAGARIRYLVTGSGPGLVFAHGLGGNMMSWWQQVPYFSRRFRCVIFSHRGFMPSVMTTGTPDPADFAGDIEALADRLALARFGILAQSMGGWGAVEFALRHPQRVSALVLAATSGTIDPRSADAESVARWHNWAIGERARLNDAGIHPAAGEAMATARPDLKFLYSGLNAMSETLDKEILRKRLLAARTRPVGDAAALTMPVLFACGADDPVFPSPAAPALAAALPNARHITFAKAGHSAYFEIADDFNRNVEAFLTA